jgi:Zn-dependent M28 family amino/carboxypeptidase
LKSARKVEEKKGRNIVGFVEGSHPVLKEECVVFMAHYDHLGMNKSGEIYNGADDNASGTATLLEVARAFKQVEKKPKRSIVFLWVTAEEVGLIGSEYYSKNPVFPLENTVACINLDMVGRVYEPRDSVWAHSPKLVKPLNEIYALVNDFDPKLKKMTEKACAKLGLTPDFSLPENFFYSSDHYHFHRNEVPLLNFSTGYSADYHQPTDDADRINFEKMKKVAELCFLVGTAIAGN